MDDRNKETLSLGLLRVANMTVRRPQPNPQPFGVGGLIVGVLGGLLTPFFFPLNWVAGLLLLFAAPVGGLALGLAAYLILMEEWKRDEELRTELARRRSEGATTHPVPLRLRQVRVDPNVRLAVQGAGGTVTESSDEKGGGSVFVVTLPVGTVRLFTEEDRTVWELPNEHTRIEVIDRSGYGNIRLVPDR